MFRRTVDLFTADENAVLADWFRTKMRSFSHGEPRPRQGNGSSPTHGRVDLALKLLKPLRRFG
jgi:hypothetical protein